MSDTISKSFIVKVSVLGYFPLQSKYKIKNTYNIVCIIYTKELYYKMIVHRNAFLRCISYIQTPSSVFCPQQNIPHIYLLRIIIIILLDFFTYTIELLEK